MDCIDCSRSLVHARLHDACRYQHLVKGYFNYMSNTTILAATDGDVLFTQPCPNASDWPKVAGVAVLSPTGNVTVCGKPVATWQSDVPGVLVNVTTAALPAGMTAEDIVQMARDTIAAGGTQSAGVVGGQRFFQHT